MSVGTTRHPGCAMAKASPRRAGPPWLPFIASRANPHRPTITRFPVRRSIVPREWFPHRDHAHVGSSSAPQRYDAASADFAAAKARPPIRARKSSEASRSFRVIVIFRFRRYRSRAIRASASALARSADSLAANGPPVRVDPLAGGDGGAEGFVLDLSERGRSGLRRDERERVLPGDSELDRDRVESLTGEARRDDPSARRLRRSLGSRLPVGVPERDNRLRGVAELGRDEGE